MKVGVFDSGVGGITVLHELERSLQGAQFVYLGDTANVPYGPKSPAQIRKLSEDCARILKQKRVDLVVVACNTASSLALDSIRSVMGKVPVIGVVEPGVEAALAELSQLARPAPVLVLATRATVRSGVYGERLRARSCQVIEQACPLLVPMIEEGWVDHPILHQTIREYVASHVQDSPPGVALLGCTHYPWIQSAFARAMPGWSIVNSAQAVSQAVLSSPIWEKHASQLRSHPERLNAEPTVEWIFTDPEAVPAFAREQLKVASTRPSAAPSSQG